MSISCGMGVTYEYVKRELDGLKCKRKEKKIRKKGDNGNFVDMRGNFSNITGYKLLKSTMRTNA